ncbi:uncharacterized protein LOC118556553 [Fundulus heteroclitus]|uniref:uncharacterized protein LOC118556553 n=1 Tax=Fundulus heteroclitus TaxID=8078 RepID=UPI00165AABC4|nr:uncharacterized protein LOC118556553 [Fundulus heteroclitus]
MGVIWSGGSNNYANSVQGRIEITRDTSKNIVNLRLSTMRPEDSAVYYCARDYSGYGYAFDYWGKGTMVTVTSATQNAPTVFPLAQCGSGSGDMVTLGCLATGFNPPSITFSWQQGSTSLDNFIQYPPIQKGSEYMGISQIQVSRQDWEARKPFKCVANHAAGQQHASMAKPNVVYELPTLKVCSSADVGQGEAYFSCFAKDFSPNTYSFTWMKEDQNITDTTAVVNTLSQGRKDANGTVLYSASSLLTLPISQLGEGSALTCVFTGRGERNTDVQRNSTTSYKECRAANCETPDVEISIIAPESKDLLVNKKGTVTCQVTVIRGTLEKLSWEDENGKDLVVEPLGVKRSAVQEVTVDITFDEWIQGVKRTCVIENSESIEQYRKDYYGNLRKSLKRPSVFMLPPVEQTREDAVILTCYVKDFSPEEVYVAWLVDDEDADAKYLFSTTKPVENNGSFYVYSQLILTRDQWEQTDMVYSCAVYHPALANSTRSIVRSIGYRTFEKTNVVNLNMNVPETCKAYVMRIAFMPIIMQNIHTIGWRKNDKTHNAAFKACDLLSSTDVRVVSPNITLYPVWEGEFGNSQVRLICALSGYFPNKLSVEWHKNGQILKDITPNEKTLVDQVKKAYSRFTEITPRTVDWEAGSTFTCTSVHNSSVFAKTIDICQILGKNPPLIHMEIPAYKTVSDKASVEATCFIRNALNANLTWLMDGVPPQTTPILDKNTTFTITKLTVPSTTWEKMTSLQCKVEHPCFSNVKTVHFSGPSVTLPHVEIKRFFQGLQKEESAAFQCDISQLSSRDLYVTLNANGQDILEKQYINLPEGPGPHSVSRIFYVPRELWKTDTRLTCAVKQGFSRGYITSNSTSNIFVNPSVELYLASSKAQGQKTLLCSGLGFNPHIKWLDGISTSSYEISTDTKGRVAVTSQLTVSETEWKSGKVFRCEVSDKSMNNVVVEEISICSVFSSTPPTFEMAIPSFKTVMTESVVKATCLVHTAFDAKVTWLLDGLSPQSDTMKHVPNKTHIASGVTVSASQWQQLKTVTCRAEHLCFSSAEKTVTVSGPLVTPPQVEIRRPFPDLLKGDSATFQCDISKLSSQDLYVTFQANGKDISDRDYVDLPEGPGPHSVSRTFSVPRELWKTDTSLTCAVKQGFSSSVVTSNSISNIFVEPSVELYLAPTERLGQQTLVCSGRGFKPQIKWFNQSEQMNSPTEDSMNKNGDVAVTSRLHVDQTEWARGMVFACEVSDSSLNKKVKKEISVCSVTPTSSYEVAVYIQRPKLEQLQKRGSVTVTCLLVGTSLSDFSITWKLGGQQSSPGHIRTEKPVSCRNGSETLHTFLSVSAEDWYSNKQVSCEAKHLCANKIYNAHISKNTALYKPVLRIVEPTFTELYRSESVTLTCLVSGFLPSDIIVHWEKNGRQLPASHYINSPSWKEPGTSYFSMRSRLNVTRAEDNKSTYSCVVVHESSETPVVASISDMFASVTYSKPSAILFEEEDKLVCLVSGFSPPSINITWFRSETPQLLDYNITEPYLGQDGKFSIQSRLRLAPIDSLPGIVLTCQVTHEGTTLTVNMSKPDTLDHCNFFDTIKDTDVSQDALKETWSMALTFLCFFLFTIIFCLVVLIVKTK